MFRAELIALKRKDPFVPHAGSLTAQGEVACPVEKPFCSGSNNKRAEERAAVPLAWQVMGGWPTQEHLGSHRPHLPSGLGPGDREEAGKKPQLEMPVSGRGQNWKVNVSHSLSSTANFCMLLFYVCVCKSSF